MVQGNQQPEFERNPWNRLRDNCYTDEGRQTDEGLKLTISQLHAVCQYIV